MLSLAMHSKPPVEAQTSSDKQAEIIAEVKQLCSQKNFSKATQIAALAVEQYPQFFQLWMLLTQIYQQQFQFDLMCQSAQQMATFHLDNSVAQIRKVQCFIYAGEMAKAIAAIDKLYQQTTSDHRFLSQLAELYLHTSQHQKVLLCHQKALQLQPNNHSYRYNLAAAHIHLGEFEQSRHLLMQLIEEKPQDFDAYYMLAGLKKASKDNNHLELFEKQRQRFASDPQAVISLHYALGKECEDIAIRETQAADQAEWFKKAFQHFNTAATARRKKLGYQVAADVNAIKKIQEVFSQTSIATDDKQKPQNAKATPIFILGLPRSGTTLVESILTSHPQVASLGEINSFAFSLMHQVGAHKDKGDLIEKSASTNFFELGNKYRYATAGYGVKADYLIDKTPLNFLYIGLIKQALPEAKIIHLKRHPMDACFAIYKTLFRMGYPFSYDLSDLAHYYAAYQSLMQHWQRLYPEQIFHLDYQDLVTSAETKIQQLCDDCGLDFQTSLLDFYQQKKTVATASAAQVRQPIYQTSVNRWRCYESQLAPLKTQLQALGVDCDG